MHTIMAPKHIAIISKSEQISIVFIRIRLKIVLQMYGNILTKSIRFLPLGVRLRVFWCVTYIEIAHLNTYSTAKSLKMQQFAVKSQKCIGYFWFFPETGVLLFSFFLVFLPFARRETSDGLEAVLQIIAMAETAGVGYGLKFVVFVFNQHTLGLLDAEL